MNKKEARKQALERHYSRLQKLAEMCGVKADGKKLSLKLWKLELTANKISTAYCNGEVEMQAHEAAISGIEQDVLNIFNGKLEGFFVNTDPRGYSLKLEESAVKKYEAVGLERDWGGYGILSPEIK